MRDEAARTRIQIFNQDYNNLKSPSIAHNFRFVLFMDQSLKAYRHTILCASALNPDPSSLGTSWINHQTKNAYRIAR
ncbi:hypothetical protein Hgul01_04592 [Herpetosiphon gulosus]|uniref:Uncharacterized protein n=1 Tax=Herpetosiphon gulosus TaxID=1973496 RepID=A0ABP9X5W0_9CHLR